MSFVVPLKALLSKVTVAAAPPANDAPISPLSEVQHGRSRFGIFARRPGLTVFLVATVLAVVITWPVVLHFGDEIYGSPGDATGAVTQYWWWGYALTHGKSIFDNTLEGVPLGSEWAQMPFVVLPLMIFAPLTAAIGPVASYNLLILSGFPLTAWATYLLARKLGINRLAAAFAGLAFAFAPYHTEKAQGHGNETHMEFIALTLYFLVRWRQSGRRLDLVLAGAMIGLQLWMDYSLTYVLAFGLVAFFIVNCALPPQGKLSIRWLRSSVIGGVIVGAVAALFVPFTILTAHRPGTGSYTAALGGAIGTLQRNMLELETYSARPREYIEPWHANPLLPSWLRAWEDLHLHGSNWTESSLFLGYTVMALAVVGLIVGRRRFPAVLGIGLIVMGVVISLPPTFSVLGLDMRAPSYYLFKVISFFRAYARFAILVLLGASLLAGAGFAVLQARLGSSRRQLLLVLPFLLLAVEFNNLPPTHVTQILPAPAEYTWLRDQPAGVLMEYPAHSGTDQALEVQVRQYELYQMVHLHPTFLNESPLSGIVATAAADLEPYYKPGVVARLKAYGVKYVFVHRDDYVKDGWQLPTTVDGLTYVSTLDGVDVYLVD